MLPNNIDNLNNYSKICGLGWLNCFPINLNTLVFVTQIPILSVLSGLCSLKRNPYGQLWPWGVERHVQILSYRTNRRRPVSCGN